MTIQFNNNPITILQALPRDIMSYTLSLFTDAEITQFRLLSQQCCQWVDYSNIGTRIARRYCHFNKPPANAQRSPYAKKVESYFKKMHAFNNQTPATEIMEGFFLEKPDPSLVRNIFATCNGNTILERLTCATREVYLREQFSTHFNRVNFLFCYCDMNKVFEWLPIDITQFSIVPLKKQRTYIVPPKERGGSMEECVTERIPPWSAYTLSSLSKFTHLNELEIYDFVHLVPIDLHYLQKIHTLQTLTLFFGSPASVTGEIPNTLSFLPHMTSLTSLSIFDWHLSEKHPFDYCMTLTQLTEFNVHIEENRGQNILDIESIIHYTHLTQLSILDKCGTFKDPTLKELKNLTSLNTLSIGITISDRFAPTLESLHNLKNLTLQMYLYEEPIQLYKTLEKLTQLSYLHLDQCRSTPQDRLFCFREALTAKLQPTCTIDLQTSHFLISDLQPHITQHKFRHTNLT